MADSTAIAGVSISVIALVIALVCLAWIVIRQLKERNLLGLGKVSGKPYDIFKGGF